MWISKKRYKILKEGHDQGVMEVLTGYDKLEKDYKAMEHKYNILKLKVEAFAVDAGYKPGVLVHCAGGGGSPLDSRERRGF